MINPHNILMSFNNTQNKEKDTDSPECTWTPGILNYSHPKKTHRQTSGHVLHVNTEARESLPQDSILHYQFLGEIPHAPGLWKIEERGLTHMHHMHLTPHSPQTHCPLGALIVSRFRQDTDNYSNCQQKLIYSVINFEMSSFPLANIFSFKNLHHEP